MKNKYINGFTLVELSVVLIIIGLVVSAVLVSQDLIDTAEQNNAISEYKQIYVAMTQFNDKYGQLPGDINFAHQLWPTDYIAIGDNSGYIATASAGAETYTMWRHLQLSEIIPGSYTGVVGSGMKPGENIFASKIENGGYWLRRPSTLGNTYHTYSNGTKQVMHLGGGIGQWSGWNHGILSTIQSYSVDKKIDDGVADAGILEVGRAFQTGVGFYGSCTTNHWGTGAASFDLDSGDDKDCLLTFIFNFM